MIDQLSPMQFMEAVGDDWRVVSDGACAFFRTDSFATSARLVNGISGALEASDRHPDVDIRDGGVTARVVTATDDYMGMTQRDVDVAKAISAVAREQGISADPSSVASVLVVVGATDVAGVMPFWQAVLDYERRADSPDEDLVDPSDRGPAFWFESMDEPRPGGGGAIHIAVWVPHEQAEARVTAALAAGGRMVRDDFAPAWWTLADAAGNEADVSTILHRG